MYYIFLFKSKKFTLHPIMLKNVLKQKKRKGLNAVKSIIASYFKIFSLRAIIFSEVSSYFAILSDENRKPRAKFYF